MSMGILPVYISTHHMHVMSVEVREGIGSPGPGRLWATMWVLEIEEKLNNSPGLIPSSFNVSEQAWSLPSRMG